MQSVGMSVPRVDAIAKVCGKAKYVDDFFERDMLHAKVFRSSVANGRVMRIDVSKAKALPGVVTVVTYEDAPKHPFPTAGHPYNLDPKRQDVADRKLLTQRVRFYGDEIAAVKLAREKKIRLHTHLAETKDEEQYCLEKVNMRPLDYMESLGWLGEDVWFAHGIHFNQGELKRLASTRTGVAHCPVSNQKLASGTAGIPQMLELGIPVGLAVDGSASNDSSNLLAELRASYLIHRSTFSHLAPDGYDWLKVATRGGASVLGRDDIGCIEVGRAADLFMVDVNRIEYVGALLDPGSILATVGVSGPVDYTIVNGRVVVKDGRLCRVDESQVVTQANKLVSKLLNS